MPVVTAIGGGHGQSRVLFIPCAGDLDGAASLLVNARGPGDGDIVLGRDQFAGRAVQNVEEAVLGGLHHDLAGLTVNVHFRQHDVLRGGIVPALAWGGLIVPNIVAIVGLERDD